MTPLTGNITVTKTPLDTGTPVTSDFGAFGGQSVWFEVSNTGGTCPVPPVLDGDNHGQCISGATHAGIKGTPLAKIAKAVPKTGAYGSPPCPKVCPTSQHRAASSRLDEAASRLG